jgi:hypothetical protein
MCFTIPCPSKICTSADANRGSLAEEHIDHVIAPLLFASSWFMVSHLELRCMFTVLLMLPSSWYLHICLIHVCCIIYAQITMPVRKRMAHSAVCEVTNTSIYMRHPPQKPPSKLQQQSSHKCTVSRGVAYGVPCTNPTGRCIFRFPAGPKGKVWQIYVDDSLLAFDQAPSGRMATKIFISPMKNRGVLLCEV